MVTAAQKSTIRRTTVKDLRERCAHMFDAHWQEVDGDPRLPLEPWWARLEEDDPCMCALVAEVDGTPVGYAAAVATPSALHDQGSATMLAIYVAPEHRRTGAGLAMIREIERWVGLLCGEILVHARRDSACARMLEALGYVEREVIYRKVQDLTRPPEEPK